MSMKEMMSGPKSNQAQLKDDLSVFPKEAIDKYEFFLKLFKIVRQTGLKKMVNDTAVARDAYIGQKQQFNFPSDERTGIRMITEFFQPAEFLKRLELHRQHICKSKTKKQQALKLYYVEIPQKERQINLIDFIPDQKNGDGMAVIQRDLDEKREEEEKKEKLQ